MEQLPDNNDFEKLRKLLALKAQEKPEQEYFDDFLHEFHRRQRQEMLKESAFTRAVRTFFHTDPMTLLRYGSVAFCSVLVAVFVIVQDFQVHQTASNDSVEPMLDSETAALRPAHYGAQNHGPDYFVVLDETPLIAKAGGDTYVLDHLPQNAMVSVSYEPISHDF